MTSEREANQRTVTRWQNMWRLREIVLD